MTNMEQDLLDALRARVEENRELKRIVREAADARQQLDAFAENREQQEASTPAA
jgi:hypothetical protein